MPIELTELYRPDRYLAAIERLARRRAAGGDPAGTGVPLSALIRDRRVAAALLADAVATAGWQPEPATIRIARHDKPREL
jgi:hypothetical protein